MSVGTDRRRRPTGVPRSVLVVGGGSFLGRHVVDALVAAGHAVGVLNRGLSSGPAPAGVRVVRGDRADGEVLAAAAAAAPDGGWSAVIDTCGYLAEHVASAVAVLRPRRYVLISSISVYADMTDAARGPDEDAPCVVPRATSAVTGADYAGAKRACELAAAGHADPLIVRCGLLTGPGDVSSAARYRGVPGPTHLDYDRFAGRLPYWPWRMGRGGEVLAPGDPAAPVQVLDARDLARWLAGDALSGPGGVLNAVGDPATMDEWIAACAAAAPPARITWVADETLVAAGTDPRLLPLWNPAVGGSPGFFRVPGGRARDRGLEPRPLAGTAFDLQAWLSTEQPPDVDVVGTDPLSPEVEADLLAAGRRAGRATDERRAVRGP